MNQSSSSAANSEASSKRNISTALSIDESKSAKQTKAEISNEEHEEKLIELSEVTKNNVDPLEYFSRFLRIPEMILKHFKGQQLLKLSEVSPSWYNFIASSKFLMKNIKIVFRENREFFPEDYDLLMNSSRRYQNIQVGQDFDSDEYKENDYSSPEFQEEMKERVAKVKVFISPFQLDFIHKSGHEWKNVSLNDKYFSRKHCLDIWNIFSSIESSVESLSVISRDRFPANDSFLEFEPLKVLQFPKLKQLKLRLFRGSIMNKVYGRFLANSVAIVKLEIDYCDELFKDGLFRQILENSNDLKSLKVKSRHIHSMFREDQWKRVQFKLNSLTVHYKSGMVLGSGFPGFLKLQSNNLEYLKLDEYYISNTFDEIMKLPKLKCLCLRFMLKSDWMKVQNEVSTSITKLRMKLKVKPHKLKFCLESMPNVKRLNLIGIDEETIKTLLSLKRKFEDVTVRYMKEPLKLSKLFQ